MVCNGVYYSWRIVAVVTISLTLLQHVDSFYTQRQRYASRMLKITPKECHAPDFPNVTGICMISLECQQRSGSVIGACRDGHLFGACCHNPTAAPLKSEPKEEEETLPSSTMPITTTTEVPSTSVVPSLFKQSSEDPFTSSSSSPGSIGTEFKLPESSLPVDSPTIPSLIDTFSELSPTFLSQLELDDTTGIYTLPQIQSEDSSSKQVEKEKDTSIPAITTSTERTSSEATTAAVQNLSSTERSSENYLTSQEPVQIRGEFLPVHQEEKTPEFLPIRQEEKTPEFLPIHQEEKTPEILPVQYDVFSKGSEYQMSGTDKHQMSGTDKYQMSETDKYQMSGTDKHQLTEQDDHQITGHDGGLFKDNMVKYIDDIVTSRNTEQSSSHLPTEETPNANDIPFSTFTEATSKSSENMQPWIWTPTPSSYNYDENSSANSMKNSSEEIIAVSVAQSVATSPSETNEITTDSFSTSTESTYPTKFTFSKLKYTPRPYKIRPTTEKVVWTRPTLSAEPYWQSLPEEVDDDANMITSTAGSFEHASEETSSSPYPSSEYASSSYPAYPSDPLDSYTERWMSSPSYPPEQPTDYPSSPASYDYWSSPTALSYLKSNVNSPEDIATNENTGSRSDFGVTNEVLPSSSSVMMSSPYASSTGVSSIRPTSEYTTVSRAPVASPTWDTSIDSFVDQVVEGIVQDLNKSNKVDELIFNQAVEKKSTTEKPVTPKHSSGSKHSVKSDKEKTVTPKPAAPKDKKPKDKTKVKVVKNPSGGNKPGGKNKVKPVKKVTTSKVTNSTRKRLDYKKDCGVRPFIKRGRIVGGTPSQFGSWPWHALVKETVWWGIFSKIKCGGVLIGAQHVLTAAHCQPQKTGTLSVVLGITDSDDSSDTRAITKTVRRVIPHPQFNARTYENDVAILELESPVDFQPHIVPICLPREDDELEGKTAYVTGMGLLKHDGERPLVLQEVDLPILNNSECQKMFVRSGNTKPIIESFICAGYEQGRKDSCGGDSGGPLSVKRTNGQWVLAGTVSHGIKCALPDQPGVYMRTSYYKPWIDRVLNMSRSRYRGIPKCNAPPLICARQRQHQQQQARHEKPGFVHTLFRIFRLARKMVDDAGRSLKKSGSG